MGGGSTSQPHTLAFQILDECRVGYLEAAQIGNVLIEGEGTVVVEIWQLIGHHFEGAVAIDEQLGEFLKLLCIVRTCPDTLFHCIADGISLRTASIETMSV